MIRGWDGEGIFFIIVKVSKGLLDCIYIRCYKLLTINAIFSYSILLRLELEVYRLALLLADGELSGV